MDKAVKPGAYDLYAPNSFVTGGAFGDKPTRAALLEWKKQLRDERAASSQEARDEPRDSPERRRLYRVVQDLQLEEERLEELLRSQFVPQHGGQQLISPRAFFVSPLFRVAGRQTPREPNIGLLLTAPTGGTVLRYTGPELRQSDGMVFMALLRLARDAQVETEVSFSAEEVCRDVFGRYDGSSRSLLREHVKRLQKGVVEFGTTSVQLCLRFDFPARGPWSVALDRDIVALFSQSAAVWVDRAVRKQLAEGLSSWLYGFVESQSRLIPIPVETLRALCGSDASSDSFVRLVRRALHDLERAGVLDSNWVVSSRAVRWRKRTGA